MSAAADTPDSTLVRSLLRNDIGEEGANAIVEVAKGKPQLTTLCGFKEDQTAANLGGNGLKDGDAILLAFDLKKNSVLVSLNLGDNQLRVEGAKIIANLLETNTTLTSVRYAANCPISYCQQPLTSPFGSHLQALRQRHQS